MRIGEVARTLNISASAIRYYERNGLIGPVYRSGGIRQFRQSEVIELQFLKLAQSAGFNLEEAKELMILADSKLNTDIGLKTKAKAKKEEINVKIRELNQLLLFLDKLTECECISLQQCVSDNCGISRK